MKKIMISVLFFVICVFTLSSFAYESFFDSLKLNSKYVVVKVENNKIYSDFGKVNGATKGLPVKVFEKGEVIKHPVTGEILGSTMKLICDGQIDEVFDKFSVIKIKSCKSNPELGDIVKVNLEDTEFYLNVDEHVDEYFKRFIQEDIKDNNLKMVTNRDDADIIVNVNKIYKGKFSVSLINKTGEVFYSKIVEESEPIYNSGNFKVSKSYDLKHPIYTITYGKIKDNEKRSLIGADENDVYLLNVDGEKVDEIKILDDFDRIINIETADINNNGLDEIYVVDYPSIGKLNTSIYEYKNGKFVKVGDLKAFVRTYYINNKPYLVAQQAHFEYLVRGKIHFVEFDNNKFVLGTKLNNPKQFNLYGYLHKKDADYYIDKDGTFYKYKNGRVLSVADKLGVYANTFLTSLGLEKGDQEKDLFAKGSGDEYRAFQLDEKDEKKLFSFSPKTRLFYFNNFLYGFINISQYGFVANDLIIKNSVIFQCDTSTNTCNNIGGTLDKFVSDIFIFEDTYGEYNIFSVSYKKGFMTEKSKIYVLKY